MRFEEGASLSVRAIGRVRSPFREKREAPRQGVLAAGIESVIELDEDPRLGQALMGLERWSHVWVLFWFDRVENWRAKVLPPRGGERRGVFATRSPHRPNPIGLTAARLLRVEERRLTFDGLDLLDGTPVLDLKPYVPYADCLPAASSGWLEDAPPDGAAPEGGYPVELSPRCREQLTFLEDQGVPLHSELLRALEPGPAAHPARRLRRDGPRGTLAVKDWRASFVVSDTTIVVEAVASGYTADALVSDITLAVHRAFVARWPSSG